MPIPFSADRACVAARCVLLTALATGAGCSNPLFQKPAIATPVNLVPPPGVAAPAATLPQISSSPAASPPSYADVDSRQLQTTLARSQDENQLLKDELTVLREQLASTSNQLASSRFPSPGVGVPGVGATPWGPPGVPGPSGVGPPAGIAQQTGGPPAAFVAGTAPRPAIHGPAAMHAAMGQLAVPGVETRFDGNVVRLEVPADRLFDGGGASLLPGGSALLTQVAGEVDRVFPRHFVGIEGHVDTEPLEQGSWGSPHQLTSARAATVFDFFTTRTPLRQGQLFLVAHGANHPVVSNATAAGRTRNRRMELVIYPERIGGGDDEAGEQ